jgi:sphingolipid delta-4 desaturase
MATATATITRRNVTPVVAQPSTLLPTRPATVATPPEIRALEQKLKNQKVGSVNNDTTLSKPHTFTWTETDEPHASRRRIILERYPQVAQLFGTEWRTFPLVMLLFTTQLSMAYLLRNASWPLIAICGWLIGGTFNHSLQLAVHEISHNLCFKTQVYNKILGIFANLVTGVPSSITFQKYHMDHHQFQGVDVLDTDVPTVAETHIFTTPLTKSLWIFMQPLFYAFRPVLVHPKPFGKWETINSVAAVVFNLLVIQYLGVKAMSYLIIGTFLGLGFHPAAGHFIAEHYEFVKGQETYSYYGFWNYFNFNVGYHNEHHDFPRIPWSRLPLLKKIAPEYYESLPSYDSYLAVFWTYITDPEIGPFSRVKRHQKDCKAVNSGPTAPKSSTSKFNRLIFVTLMTVFFIAIIAFVLYHISKTLW